LVRLRFFEIEFAPDWDAEGGARPTPERDVHDAQHEVHAAPRAVFLPGGACPIPITGEAFDMVPSFFLGRIVEADAP
jgi:hypothetical protein